MSLHKKSQPNPMSKDIYQAFSMVKRLISTTLLNILGCCQNTTFTKVPQEIVLNILSKKCEVKKLCIKPQILHVNSTKSLPLGKSNTGLSQAITDLYF